MPTPVDHRTPGSPGFRAPDPPNLVTFRHPADAGAEYTARGHGFMAVERLRALLEQLHGEDRSYVVDLAHGMLADFVTCPDGCSAL